MPPTISWGLLSEALLHISLHADAKKIIDSAYYRTSLQIFTYLCRNQHNDGSIHDPNIGSTLDDQYHYANLTLSAVIFYILQGDGFFYNVAVKSLSYYSSVPLEKRKGAVEFSNFALLMTYLLLRETPQNKGLTQLLRSHIEKMIHHAVVDSSHAYGNNFVAMRAVNHMLRYKILRQHDDETNAMQFMEASLQWQFEDGIFYDYPRTFHDPLGIPSLTYHAKMTLMTLLFGLISRKQHIIESALRGLDALTVVMAKDGEAFYYGRSNNALYGYASGIFAMRLAANYLGNNPRALNYSNCEQALYDFITKDRPSDGHLYIVPNKHEKKRCGFDSYMYVTVYNAFMMSMLLLSAMVQAPPTGKAPERSDALYHLKESGFIVKKGSGIETAINAKGHNYYQQYLLDPRYTCGTPLYLMYEGKDILPAIPLSSLSYADDETQKQRGGLQKILRNARRAVETTQCWEHLRRFNPLHAGFLPCIEAARKIYLPLHVGRIDVMQADDVVCIRLFGNLTSITRDGVRPLLLLLCEIACAFLHIPLHRVRQLLVRETDRMFERRIFIGNDFMHFVDRLPFIRGGKCWFTLRTYAAWRFKHEQDYAQWSGNGCSIIVPLSSEMGVEQYASLGSSKGWATCWKILGAFVKAHQPRSSLVGEHMVIVLDHTTMQKDLREYIRGARAKLSSTDHHLLNGAL